MKRLLTALPGRESPMRMRRLAAATLAVALTALGLASFAGYAAAYMSNRGFGPPVSSVAASGQGRIVTIPVHSPALGGATEQALVYLPSAYRHDPARRFPVVYLLHGTPGDPRTAYVNSLHVGPRMDSLIASGAVQPMIVVMPPGSPSTYNGATQWANGPQARTQWFTYLTRDVVHTIDTTLRTIPRAAARGIGGFSSGADAAINAALLDPGVFRVAEGWSGDYRQSPASVGHDAALVRRFSAVGTAAGAAPTLARAGSRIYLYAGRADKVLPSTLAVARDLRSAGVRVRLDITRQGHAWTLWAGRFDGALVYFSQHLAAR
jgi:enterochelin esterase-like enzyme